MPTPNVVGPRLSFYLAARYGRRQELEGYARALRQRGHVVTSRWLEGRHEGLSGSVEERRARWDADGGHVTGPDAAVIALDDLEDIRAAEVFVVFTEGPDANSQGRNRGGRHVEYGYALALGKPIIRIGPAESVFHALVGVLDHRGVNCPGGALARFDEVAVALETLPSFCEGLKAAASVRAGR